MLSYMLPVEEKTSPPRNLNLNLNLNNMTTTTATSSSSATTTSAGTAAGAISSSGNSKIIINTSNKSSSFNTTISGNNPKCIKMSKSINSKTGGGGGNTLNGNGNIAIIDENLCDEKTKLLLASERTEHNLNHHHHHHHHQQQQHLPPHPPPHYQYHKSCFTSNIPRDLKLDNLKQQNISSSVGGGGTGIISGKDELSNASGEDGGDESSTKNSTTSSSTKKGGSKLNKVGNKNVTLKRVSFGSSKGSMVETLVFETPTPLPEHAEREFGYGLETTSTPSLPGGNKFINMNNNITNNNNNNNHTSLDDSGIELQEELERSKVRVTFFQSSKPQQISPPESYSHFSDSNFPLLSESFSTTDGTTYNNDRMAATTAQQPNYDRQISTESGWDNPFRPGGDLSREADEIVNMIKGGKPITPTSDANQTIANGSAQKNTGNHAVENGTAVLEGATKVEVSHAQTAPAQNGTKSPLNKTAGGKANGDAKPSQTQVSNQVIPGPTSASHVVIEDKKKKKCTCCVIQ